VVTTPLRIARVAAALGTDGTIREAPIVTGVNPTVNTEFLPAADARTLASYLRDAVLSGTGRQLKDHPARIAGKTGTAEVDEANPHAWFAGFAPYGPATRRIAFAVVLDNAGYGGIAAARVAGESRHGGHVPGTDQMTNTFRNLIHGTRTLERRLTTAVEQAAHTIAERPRPRRWKLVDQACDEIARPCPARRAAALRVSVQRRDDHVPRAIRRAAGALRRDLCEGPARPIEERVLARLSVCGCRRAGSRCDS
jgi:membrane peptidoglycan carboxypeptidase